MVAYAKRGIVDRRKGERIYDQRRQRCNEGFPRAEAARRSATTICPIGRTNPTKSPKATGKGKSSVRLTIDG
jgi:hypothetical protein